MRIDIITVLPEMLKGFVNESILARAQKKDWQKSVYIISVIIQKINGDVWTIILMADLPEW